MGPDEGFKDQTITVDFSREENKALATIGGNLALAGNAIDGKGLLLYRQSDLDVKAFIRECRQQQCIVGTLVNGVSTCPCHGSK